jgi:dCMP deaminase
MYGNGNGFRSEDLLRSLYKETLFRNFGISENEITADLLQTVEDMIRDFRTKVEAIDDPPVLSWDEYYYNVCRQVAKNSKCYSRKIGAVLVSDKTIVGTGYNGPPRGIPVCDGRWFNDNSLRRKYASGLDDDTLMKFKGICPRRVLGFKSGEGLDMCVAGHAERNALINSAREGISTKGTTLYMTCGIPCSNCLIEIINAGVSEVVVTSLELYDEGSEYLLKNSDLAVRVFDFIIS